ncbi:MAG: HRDC domain-containing protein [Clostridium perfringens]
MPKNKEELMKVKGLAKVKINKYGEEILGVLK